MPKKAEKPFKMGYDPKIYTSPELDPECSILLSNYHRHPKKE